jgi:hypothetical protein
MRLASGLLLIASLSSLPAPERVLALQGETHHVQGIALDGGGLWVTAVDRAQRQGLLLRFDLASGKPLLRLSSGEGERFHPGGFDLDATSLWIPAAEYKPLSSAWIERRDRHTGALLSRFETTDHIGAIARLPDRLLGANWDARRFYEWTTDGKLIRVRDNPTPWRFQDLKFRDGLLVGAGVGPKGSNQHAIVWLDPKTLQVRKLLPAGATDRGVPFPNEGLDLRDGRLFLLPEDTPSRLFTFSIP